MNHLTVLRCAFAVGLEDFRSAWSWRTWIGGWLLRVLAQATFFTLIGTLLASRERTYFLLIGNTVVTGVAASMLAVQATTWERMDGTYPLLVVAPVNFLSAFVGRTLVWMIDGIATSCVAFVVVGLLFHLPITLSGALEVVPLILVVNLSVYGLAIFAGVLAMRRPALRNLISVFTTLTIMSICGVNVPIGFWPLGVQLLADVLPVTHGLTAIRELLGHQQTGLVLINVALELLVGAIWFLAASVSFRTLVEGGRRDGSIEFTGL